MRKTLLFVVVLALSLGRGERARAAEAGALRVGAARVDITPPADPANPPSGRYITGYELVREPVEAPLREGKVPRGRLDPKVADTLERWIESEGQLLGEEVIRVMTGTARMAGDVRLWGAQKTLTCPARRRTNTGREGSPGTYEDTPDPVVIRLGLVGIGDTALATVNGEVYSAIGQRLKRQSPLANTVVVTLANGRANSGYIPDDASFGAYTFQVLGSCLKPGCAEQGIADGLTELVTRYLGEQGTERGADK
jgi:neutral ceramidase